MDKKDKIFGIYSLVLPVILVGLFFICLKFGTTLSDVKYSPYGKVSDFITYFTMLVICPVLYIINRILFRFAAQKKVILYNKGLLLLVVLSFLIPIGIFTFPIIIYLIIKKAGGYGKNVKENIKILIANFILTFQLMFLLGTLWALLMLIFVGPIYLIMWFIYLIYFIMNYKKKTEETNEIGQVISDRKN